MQIGLSSVLNKLVNGHDISIEDEADHFMNSDTATYFAEDNPEVRKKYMDWFRQTLN